MDNNPHVRLKLHDRSYSIIVKKEVRRIAETVGFPAYRLAEIDIIISEMVSNLNKHSHEGEALVRSFANGIELISIDHGPGMANSTEMLKDGVSTTKTLGHGLGAIRRLSDDFDIYSVAGWGTIVLSRVYKIKPSLTRERKLISLHSVMLPKPGQQVCGDAFDVIEKKYVYKIIALDGLGHGPEAANASQAAIKEFLNCENSTPVETLREIHSKIKGTRGAVGMILHLDVAGGSLSFTGLGNISARLMSLGKNKSLISYNGIIGHTIPNTLTNNIILLSPQETLIVHSDGLKSRWDIDRLPNIMDHDGSVVASALYKDFSRKTDDLLILVVKNLKR